jgi:hypothetical protein
MSPTYDSVPSAWFPSAIEDQKRYAIILSFLSTWTPFPWRQPSPCSLVVLYGAYSPPSTRRILGWVQCSFTRSILQTDSIGFRSMLTMFQSRAWWFQPTPASPSLSGYPGLDAITTIVYCRYGNRGRPDEPSTPGFSSSRTPPARRGVRV